MTGSSDELNVDKVKAAIRKTRAESGATPAVGSPAPTALPPAVDSSAVDSSVKAACDDDVDSEKVRAMLKQTRACAIKNAQSSESLKEIQAATPGRGIQTSKFKTRGASPPSGAVQMPNSDAKQKKEKSS